MRSSINRLTLFALPIIAVQQFTLALAFSSPIQPDVVTSRAQNNNSIQFSIVKTNEDILSLADLRYQEWMSDEPNPPKLSSFRLATAEIYEERKREGSKVFLASKGDATIGAAELSPIELRGVFTRDWDSSSPRVLLRKDIAPRLHSNLRYSKRLQLNYHFFGRGDLFST